MNCAKWQRIQFSSPSKPRIAWSSSRFDNWLRSSNGIYRLMETKRFHIALGLAIEGKCEEKELTKEYGIFTLLCHTSEPLCIFWQLHFMDRCVCLSSNTFNAELVSCLLCSVFIWILVVSLVEAFPKRGTLECSRSRQFVTTNFTFDCCKCRERSLKWKH
jgi:hypothetical protein